MNNQEFFDKCVAHLRQQRGKSLNDSEECVYEAPDGRRCAVGGVCSPELLAAIRQNDLNAGTGINKLLQNLPAAREFFAGVNPELMRAMQRVHDERGTYEWENGFRLIAHRYDLRYTAP